MKVYLRPAYASSVSYIHTVALVIVFLTGEPIADRPTISAQ